MRCPTEIRKKDTEMSIGEENGRRREKRRIKENRACIIITSRLIRAIIR